MLIIGDKEIEEKNITVRARKDGDLGSIGLDEFLAKLQKEIEVKGH